MDVNELEDEIEILKKRVHQLEKKEAKRASFKYLKLIIKILLFGAVIFGLWKGYNYIVNEIPNIISNKIQEINPFKKR